MRVFDEELLATYRTPGECDFCGRTVKMRCAHHVFARVSGRLDLPFNLLAVGMEPWDCHCHRQIEDGVIGLEVVLDCVARRDGVTPEWIRDEVFRLRRLPQPRIDAEYERLIAEHYARFAAEQASVSDPENPHGKPPAIVLVIDGRPYVVERNAEGWKLTKTAQGEPEASYEVQPAVPACECQDSNYRKRACKHLRAVKHAMEMFR